MRNGLELMETIEKYITGKMSGAEKNAFEKELQNDNDLQKEVQLQKELMQGIKRAAIKQSAVQAFKKYKFTKSITKWGLTGLSVAIIATGSFLFYNKVINKTQNENAAQELPELNENGKKEWSDADKYLPLQGFELNNEKDTVIETKDGIVFAIPANCFLDANGKPVKGTIQLEIKEALKAADMMKAGLSTKSGDKLLETGGMFYINARKDNTSLKIDAKNGIYAEIPTNEVKPNMQLFEGKRLADGTIDWINPKSIVKDLIPVDIMSLNFYPPNYLDSLKSWGYNTKDKRFTDSLYYSFAAYFDDEYNEVIVHARLDSIYAVEAARAAEEFAAMQAATGRNPNRKEIIALEKKYKRLYNSESELPSHFGKDSSISIHGINPAKIKAIWNKKFQNTLLSTREFEERLPYIHRTCDEHVLDMYVNNLDKNLSTIDSMVAEPHGERNAESEVYYSPGYPEFLKFAQRGDGKVKNGNNNVELLKRYYAEKSKIFAEAIAKTVNGFWNKENKKTEEAMDKRNEQHEKEFNRITDNYKKELDLNLDEAYRQLGKKRPLPTPQNPYGVHIATTGWYNVDAYVIESTTNRTSLDYTDPQTGKKAMIKYEVFSASIKNFKDYDRVLVYLVPNELNSFMRVKNANDLFEERLNELMTYKMVCIAYKGEESFYYSEDSIKPKNYSISLIKTTNADIQNNVNKLGDRKQVKAMNDELNYMEFEKQEGKRQEQLTKIKDLQNKVRPVIFSCMPSITRSVSIADSTKK